jgi:hypothetical protein
MDPFPKLARTDTGALWRALAGMLVADSGVLSQVFLSLCLNDSTNTFSEQAFFLYFSVLFLKNAKSGEDHSSPDRLFRKCCISIYSLHFL